LPFPWQELGIFHVSFWSLGSGLHNGYASERWVWQRFFGTPKSDHLVDFLPPLP
jgi:hypothetical protein